jgi:hypothetical protein
MRNDLTFGFPCHTQLAAGGVLTIPAPGDCLFLRSFPPHGSRRRNLTFDRQILTLASKNRVVISFLPAETSLCLVSLRSKDTFPRGNITFWPGWTSMFSISLRFVQKNDISNYLNLRYLAVIIQLCSASSVECGTAPA